MSRMTLIINTNLKNISKINEFSQKDLNTKKKIQEEVELSNLLYEQNLQNIKTSTSKMLDNLKQKVKEKDSTIELLQKRIANLEEANKKKLEQITIENVDSYHVDFDTQNNYNYQKDKVEDISSTQNVRNKVSETLTIEKNQDPRDSDFSSNQEQKNNSFNLNENDHNSLVKNSQDTLDKEEITNIFNSCFDQMIKKMGMNQKNQDFEQVVSNQSFSINEKDLPNTNSFNPQNMKIKYFQNGYNTEHFPNNYENNYLSNHSRNYIARPYKEANFTDFSQNVNRRNQYPRMENHFVHSSRPFDRLSGFQSINNLYNGRVRNIQLENHRLEKRLNIIKENVRMKKFIEQLKTDKE